MSQCQTYTAAPERAAQPLPRSTTFNLIVNGTPAATPPADPKLDRMSRRTTPLSVRTSGPLEPSPGNGPAVSLGIVEHAASDPVAVFLPDPHPTSATTPTPARSLSVCRRSMRLVRSKERPQS